GCNHDGIQIFHLQHIFRVFKMSHLTPKHFFAPCGGFFLVKVPDIAYSHHSKVFLFLRHFNHIHQSSAPPTASDNTNVYPVICTHNSLIGSRTCCCCLIYRKCCTSNSEGSFSNKFSSCQIHNFSQLNFFVIL